MIHPGILIEPSSTPSAGNIISSKQQRANEVASSNSATKKRKLNGNNNEKEVGAPAEGALKRERRSKRQRSSEMKKEERKRIAKRLRKEVWQEIRPIASGSLAMVASTLSNQAVPRLLGGLLDQSRTGASQSCPNPVATAATTNSSSASLSALALVVIGGGLASFHRTFFLDRAQDSIAARLRAKAFDALMMKDFQWFQQEKEGTESDEKTNESDTAKSTDKKNDVRSSSSSVKDSPTSLTSGAIGNILNDDVQSIAKALTTTVANGLRSSASMLFATYHMININPSLFGYSVAVVPLIGTAAIVLRKVIKKYANRQRELQTKAAAYCEERLVHIAMVKMSNREADEVKAYQQLQDEIVQVGRSLSVANGAFMGFIFAASSSALLMVFDVGGKRVASGAMTAGSLTSFATYTFLLGLGTSGVMRAYSEWNAALDVSAPRLYQLIGDEEDDTDIAEKKTKETASNKAGLPPVSELSWIQLENLDFAYSQAVAPSASELSNPEEAQPSLPGPQDDDANLVLKNVSLKLERGKVIALAGKNGSGKSTIASLLAALYPPKKGSITLSNGTNYTTDLDRQQQKQIVQVVPQQPTLFHTSVLENVRYSHPDATEEDVYEALKLANCDEFLSKMEGGVHGSVGPNNGSRLSGGQRQRLGLARALLGKPLLLVLDEPTSALDAEGETAVADVIASCRTENRAVLLITHRKKSLEELADHIVVLSDGQIAEQGTWNDLKQKKDGVLVSLLPELTKS